MLHKLAEIGEKPSATTQLSVLLNGLLPAYKTAKLVFSSDATLMKSFSLMISKLVEFERENLDSRSQTEQFQYMQQAKEPRQGKAPCSYCLQETGGRKLYHPESKCRRKERDREQKNSKISNTGKSGSSGDGSQNTGHLKNPPGTTITRHCYVCGSPGHLAGACPDRHTQVLSMSRQAATTSPEEEPVDAEEPQINF